MINVTNNGDGTTTVMFSYTVDSQRLQDTLEDWAHWVYKKSTVELPIAEDDTTIDWDNLTNAQKLELIDRDLVRYAKHCAKSHYKNQYNIIDNSLRLAEAEERYWTEE